MWTSVAQITIDPAASGSKTYLPSVSPGVCRFCGRTAPAVTFRKDAHALPATLGNRYLLSREECDECNEAGSVLEDDLAKRMTVARVMSRIAGRSGGVKHRFGDRPSFIESDPKNNLLIVDRTEGDDSLHVRRTRQGLRYIIKVPKHRPLNAIRAVARIGFMLAHHADLPHWDHVRRWIRREVSWPHAFMHEGFIPGTGLSRVRVGVDVHASPAPQGAMFRVGFAYGHTLLSLHLPTQDMALTDAEVPKTGRSPYPPHEVSWRRLAVMADVAQSARHEEVEIYVPEFAEMPPPTHDEIAEAAYYRWLARGGDSASIRPVDDWLDGEQELLWRNVPTMPKPWPPMPTPDAAG